VIDPIVAQLTQGITPEKIALTIAVGSAFALFPVLGTTTILCLIVGISLRLNQPIIQIVNAVCAPVHLPAIYGMVRLGTFLFGLPYNRVGIRLMNHMFWDSPHEFWNRFGEIALHAIVAWLLCAPFWIVIMYFIALPVLREITRRRAEAATQRIPCPPPEHPVP
jgi:uncharacterized protein (DUF2062 family)